MVQMKSRLCNVHRQVVGRCRVHAWKGADLVGVWGMEICGGCINGCRRRRRSGDVPGWEDDKRTEYTHTDHHGGALHPPSNTSFSSKSADNLLLTRKGTNRTKYQDLNFDRYGGGGLRTPGPSAKGDPWIVDDKGDNPPHSPRLGLKNKSSVAIKETHNAVEEVPTSWTQ